MRHRRALLACLVPLVSACGSPTRPTAAPPAPDLRGVWQGAPFTFSWADTYLFAPDISRTAACKGSLDVTGQDGNAFGGRYVITCPADGGQVSSGAIVDGRVDAEGRVSLRLRGEEGFEPGLLPGWFTSPCVIAADTPYEGTLRDGALSLRRRQDFACLPGRVFVDTAILGRRS